MVKSPARGDVPKSNLPMRLVLGVTVKTPDYNVHTDLPLTKNPTILFGQVLSNSACGSPMAQEKSWLWRIQLYGIFPGNVLIPFI